jgi:GT2 family glycosyltransferase
MLLTRSCIERVGLFDEAVFGIAYNDVDYCLRAVNLGIRIVWTPFATLIHHESASRGSDMAQENIARFRKDQQNLRERHRTDIYEDRAFNPWYSKYRSDPIPVVLKELPPAR